MGSSEDIQKLNQVIALVDQQSASFKRNARNMPQVKLVAEKKLIIELIDSGLVLVKHIGPQAAEISADFKRLKQDLKRY